MFWANEAQDKISKIINPILLEFYNKKNLRSLSNEEVLELDTIRQQIRQNPQDLMNGDGSIDEVQYTWSATTELFLPPPDNFISESSQVVSYSPRFRLYQVQLELSYRSAFRSYQFKEVAWLPNAQPQ